MISHSPPSMKHNGITIVLSHPGRFDVPSNGVARLCNGPAARLLDDALSTTRFGRHAIDIRTIECKEPLLPTTKVVLLAGERAALTQGIPSDKFKAWRGAPLERGGIVYIPTFHLQDACDYYQDNEVRNPLNPLNKLYEQSNNNDTDTESDGQQQYQGLEKEEEDEASTKDYGKTLRRNYYIWAKYDIRKACRILEQGIKRTATTYILSYRPSEAIEAIRSVQPSDTLYFDLETCPLSGRIICIGFSTGADKIYSVAMQSRMYGSTENYAELGGFYREFISALKRVRRVVAHNTQFDLWILAWLYKIPPPAQEKIYDTMVSHHRLFVGLEKSLGHCISLYTDLPYHKDTAIFTPNNFEQLKQLLTYNAKDVGGMALVAAEQERIAQSIPGMPESIAQGNAAIRPLLCKSIRGMLVNTASLCETIDKYRARANFIEQKIIPVLANRPAGFNVRSVPQVSKLLYDDWELPKPSGRGASLTGKETIYDLAIKYPLPTLKAIVVSRAEHHNASQLSFKLWRGDRVTSHLEATTDSWRLRSRALFGIWGTNVQNWPKKLRRVVVAKPGHKLVQVDQKNAEALIVAYLVKANTRYRQLLLSGIKLHTYVALHLFKSVWDELMEEDCDRFIRCEIADLQKQPRIKELDKVIRASDNNEPSTRWYYMAKQTGLSANYGVGASEFSKNTLKKSDGQVFIPINRAERFLSIYRTELFPEIETQFQAYVLECARDGILRNMHGFPRILHEHPQFRTDARNIKKHYAWIPQSTVGTITNIADSEMSRKLDEGELSGFEIWTNTHDSLLVHCLEERVSEVAQIVQQHMNQELTNQWGEKFRMGSDASVSDNWYDMKELKV